MNWAGSWKSGSVRKEGTLMDATLVLRAGQTPADERRAWREEHEGPRMPARQASWITDTLRLQGAFGVDEGTIPGAHGGINARQGV